MVEFNFKSYDGAVQYLINQIQVIICINCGTEYTIKNKEDLVGLVCEQCGNVNFRKKVISS